ncbi:MOS1T transposase, partial [Pseudoatta argentina]
MKIVYKWEYLDYVWDNPEHKENAINCNNYNVSTCSLNDVDKADDGRIFATVPKMFNFAVPASVVTVSGVIESGGPLLHPYPDWSWYNNSNMCDNIVNVYTIHIKCNHIFVLDNGYGPNNESCHPKLLIFNLENNTLVKTIIIPPDVATNETGSGFLITPFVYLPEKCECNRLLNEMIVFISDMIGSGLVIYDSSKNSSCRVESDFMGATDYINITIANQTIPFMAKDFSVNCYISFINILDLFYNPFMEKKGYKMKLKKLLKCPDKETANNQSKLVGELPIQTGPLASTKCSLFLSNFLQNSIQGTNACKKFCPKDMVVFAQNDKKLQIVTGMKALQHHNELISLSTMTYITYPNDPSQTLSELGKILQVDESTVSKRLKGLGMIQKQGHWVPYELLLLSTITGDRYRLQLMRLSRALKEKRPLYAQRHDKVILLHDNARPHVVKPVKTYLETLKWEVLPHPLYSPDIAPSDFHLFRSMAHGLADRRFHSYEDAQKWIDSWIASKDMSFFRRGIHVLPERWEKVVSSDGQYFK